MLNDGVLKIYKKIPAKSTMGKPVEVLEFYADYWFGDLSFSVNEYYTAKQAQISVDKRVRIHQDRTLSNQHVVVLEGQQYQLGRVFHGIERGIQITDITLERVMRYYEIT